MRMLLPGSRPHPSWPWAGADDTISPADLATPILRLPRSAVEVKHHAVALHPDAIDGISRAAAFRLGQLMIGAMQSTQHYGSLTFPADGVRRSRAMVGIWEVCQIRHGLHELDLSHFMGIKLPMGFGRGPAQSTHDLCRDSFSCLTDGVHSTGKTVSRETCGEFACDIKRMTSLIA